MRSKLENFGNTAIAQDLDHTSTDVTEAVYGRFSPNYLRTAAQSLEV